MAVDALRDTADAVVAMYNSFSADNPEGRAQLAEMAAKMRAWFESPERVVTDAAQFCVDRLVDAEMDHLQPGNRGLGRVADTAPRLGARHRAVISKLSSDERTELRRLLRRHFLCGYAFYEFSMQTNRTTEPSLSRDKLFDMWIQTLYTSFSDYEAPDKDAGDLHELWFGATGRSIRDHLVPRDKWQEIDQEIVTYYFNAGMTLRHLEGNPLTDEQVLNAATGGGNDAAKKLAAETGGNYTAESVYKRVSDDGWPRLSEQDLALFTDEARAFIRAREQELIRDSRQELDEIYSTCRIRPQYAKTYRVLRRSKRETLEKMRVNLRSWPMPEEAKSILLRVFEQVISYKHAQMAAFFRIKWGEDIENWAGKEGSALDRAGCLVMFGTLLVVAMAGIFFMRLC
jgi:hypothetical protein